MKRKLLRGCAVAALVSIPIAAVVTPIASLALMGTLFVTGLVNLHKLHFPFPAFYCWWPYAWNYGLDPRFTLKLALTFGIPFALLWAPVGLSLARRRPRRLKPARDGQEAIEPDRAPSNLHGKAEWMTMDEANTVFTGPHPVWGGIPVGEAYRPDLDTTARPFAENDPSTWGQGGKAPLLMTSLTSGATSGIIIGGAGSGKSMGFYVPAMCTWRGSAVLMDPQQQVAGMVTKMREGMGHTVAIIDPTAPHLGSFNPLSLIDLDHPLATDYLKEFVDWCAAEPDDGKKSDDSDKTFAEWGKELQTCILADLLWSDLPAEQRTPHTWRQRLITPEEEMRKYLASIYGNTKSKYARDLAGTLMRVTPKTFSGLYRHSSGSTRFLSTPAYAEMLSCNTFDPRMLTRGDLTVIVQLSDDAMRASPAVGRIVIGSLARIVLRAQGRVATPIPFFLDEMDGLKFMPILEVLRDRGRKSGAVLFPGWQSTGQIEKSYGKDGKRSWYASAAWRMYLQVNDEETAAEVSKRCGTRTVLARSEGISTSRQNPLTGGSWSRGTNDSVSERPQPLISEYQVQTDVRPDEAIIIPRGRRALRCGRPLYWRRPEMKERIERDAYHRVEAE